MRQLLATTIFFLLTVGITFAKPGDGVFQPSSGESREKLSWQTDIKPALAMAAENYQPVVTVFTMPTCLWCKRLKQDVLTLPEHTSLLENYVRVEIDISRDPETAARYGIRSVPAILILSSDGTTRDASHGLIEPARLQLMLKGALNSEFLRKNDEAFNATLKLLNSPPVPAEAWPGILSALGDKLKREDLKNAILDIAPFPKKELITFLQHERLAVRLGTLEILESKAGTHFNYDPWLDTADTDANRIALEDWVKWAADKPNIDTVSPLREITDDEFDTLIVDLVSDNRARRERALITLRQGGPNIIPRLGKIITDRAGLPSGDILRLKAAQYTLIIPRDSAVEGSVIAQRLLFGNLDARIGAIGNLQDLKADGVPVLAEFINDPEPLVRETVIDALIKSGGQHVQPLLVAQLDRETDKNVTYTILKNLGTLETKTALSKLISYAAHENEDFAVIAIEGIRNLDNKTPDVIKVIGNGLKDPRWRVRVASIQTAAKLNDPKLTPGVIQTTQDEDEFVQQAAIEAIAKIGTKQSLSDLTPLFNQRPSIRPAIIKAYVSKKATIPDAILDLLEKDSPDVLLPALDIMGNSSSFKQVDFLQ